MNKELIRRTLFEMFISKHLAWTCALRSAALMKAPVDNTFSLDKPVLSETCSMHPLSAPACYAELQIQTPNKCCVAYPKTNEVESKTLE